ncbi:helicase-associated domain-containing protein [Streptomyces sp. NPDC048442]|uniref:WYL domain-containing protein n=1 Tax=Streptomyces sp. NPDC048442 TaxID=3154823 RepID=UPI003426E752
MRTVGALIGKGSDDLSPALDQLADLALAWPGPDGLLHSSPALAAFWSHPLGLGPSLVDLTGRFTSEHLGRTLKTLGLPPGTRREQRVSALLTHHDDQVRLRELIGTAPPGAYKILAADRPERYKVTESPERRWLRERALLVGTDFSMGPDVIPSEVTMALRGPNWRAPYDPQPPAPALVPVGADEVEREAAAAATAFAGQAAAVLAQCAARPLALLKSGGVGAREIARLGRATGCQESVVRLVLGCGLEAGLLGEWHDGELSAMQPQYDNWLGREPAARYAVLAWVWWRCGHTPTLSRDTDGKPLPAALWRDTCPGCRAAREELLRAGAALPEGRGVSTSAQLTELLAWLRPYDSQLTPHPAPFSHLVAEAEALGVLARGALSTLGAALLANDPEDLHSYAQRLLPGTVDRVRIGADLTAVATGTPGAELAAVLDGLADREPGAASATSAVWRISPGSLRRAMDGGETPDRISAALRKASAQAELPQPLAYLIADTARRHGHVRVASAACVLHTEDTALLAELAAHRTLAPALGLRLLAPTVLIGTASTEAALEALRAEGYAPVPESPDGTLGVPRPRKSAHSRTRKADGTTLAATFPFLPRTVPAGPRTTPDLLSCLRTAPDRNPVPDPESGIPFDTATEEILAYYATSLTLTDIRQLAHAIHENRPIAIHYTAASGARTVRTLSTLTFDPPYLEAYCHLRDAGRVFSLSGITSVLPE